MGAPYIYDISHLRVKITFLSGGNKHPSSGDKSPVVIVCVRVSCMNCVILISTLPHKHWTKNYVTHFVTCRLVRVLSMSTARFNYLFWDTNWGKCLQSRTSERRLFGRSVEAYRFKANGHVKLFVLSSHARPFLLALFFLGKVTQ
jgi:hypothetical protein